MALLAVFVLLITSFCGGSWAQSPSPAKPPVGSRSTDKFCFDYASDKLSPCNRYMIGDKEEGKPAVDDGCCTGLRDFFSNEPDCVCFLINPNNGLSSLFNLTKALELPGPCNATVPRLNKCLAQGSPDSALVGSPGDGGGNSAAPAGASAVTFLVGNFLAVVAVVAVFI